LFQGHRKQFTYFKVACCQRWASEESWKYHVDWYWKITTDVTIGNLNVLNLGCCNNKLPCNKQSNK